MLRGSPVEWQGSNCRDTDGDSWFPERGSAQRTAKAAKAVCNGEDGVHGVCPYKARCLEYALTNRERFGVWGGMSENERNKERARRRADGAEFAAIHAAWMPDQAGNVPMLPPVLMIVRNTVPPMTKVERAVSKSKAAATSSRRKPAGDLARFADARKSGMLLKDVERHLLSLPQNENRHMDKLHVSDLVKNDVCPRVMYRRIKDARAGKVIAQPAPRFQLDNIFSEGDRIHAKWQQWFWDMGTLFGRFHCWACDHEWMDEAPKKCEQCGAKRGALQYREVPLADPTHLLIGHADGELRDRGALLEIKSIGAGTVRVEAPRMHAEYTRKYTDEEGVERSYLDHESLWRDLHRPFASHLRQGYLYLALRKLKESEGWPPIKRIIFIYEYKPTQATKEFVIFGDDDKAAELLEICKDIVYALEEGLAPACINGRKRCAACKAYEAQMREADEEIATLADDPASAGAGGAAGADGAPPPRRTTRIARRRDRAGRLPTDVPAGSVHSVGRLLGRASGDGLR